MFVVIAGYIFLNHHYSMEILLGIAIVILSAFMIQYALGGKYLSKPSSTCCFSNVFSWNYNFGRCRSYEIRRTSCIFIYSISLCHSSYGNNFYLDATFREKYLRIFILRMGKKTISILFSRVYSLYFLFIDTLFL